MFGEGVGSLPGDGYLGFQVQEAVAAIHRLEAVQLQQACTPITQTEAELGVDFAAEKSNMHLDEGEVLRGALLRRLEAYSQRAWLWWRLPLSDECPTTGSRPRGSLPHQRQQHAAASVSAERASAAVAAFGGLTSQGTLADNEVSFAVGNLAV